MQNNINAIYRCTNCNHFVSANTKFWCRLKKCPQSFNLEFILSNFISQLDVCVIISLLKLQELKKVTVLDILVLSWLCLNMFRRLWLKKSHDILCKRTKNSLTSCSDLAVMISQLKYEYFCIFPPSTVRLFATSICCFLAWDFFYSKF